MDRQEFLERRVNGLGGSDAAAAVGLCPWKTRYALYLDKTEPVVDRVVTESMHWGTILEPVVRQRYCDVTGNAVTLFESQVHHPEHAWMFANLDGQVSPSKLYEGKTYWTADGWGPSGSDEVPEHYTLQVQHYMAVTGAESTDVAVLIAGNDFRILTVYADPEIQSLLIEREAEFWHKHVVPRIPPELETEDDVIRRFPRSLGNMATATPHEFDAWERLRKVRADLKLLETQKEECELVLKKAIGDRDGLEFNGQQLITWKSAKDSESFDKAKFQQEHAALYRQYLRVVDGSRRFLVKEPKVKK